MVSVELLVTFIAGENLKNAVERQKFDDAIREHLRECGML